MNKRKAIISTLLTILLVGVAAWAFGFFTRTDPAIAKLQEIGNQMQDKNMSDAQRNQLRDDFRQNMRSMTDEQRRAFFDANRDQWTGRMQQRMDEYFAMSKADQQKRLDDIINRAVAARNSSQQGNGQAANRGNRGGNRGGPSRRISQTARYAGSAARNSIRGSARGRVWWLPARSVEMGVAPEMIEKLPLNYLDRAT
jgi:uncharacterized membrane protein